MRVLSKWSSIGVHYMSPGGPIQVSTLVGEDAAIFSCGHTESLGRRCMFGWQHSQLLRPRQSREGVTLCVFSLYPVFREFVSQEQFVRLMST